MTETGKAYWKIQFNWVKAHVGFEGNELLDIVAKDSATNVGIKES